MKTFLSCVLGAHLTSAQTNLRSTEPLEIIAGPVQGFKAANPIPEGRLLQESDLEFSIIQTLYDQTCLSPQPEGTNFAVSVECNGDANQLWAYNTETKQIVNGADQTKCLTVWSVTSSTYVWASTCSPGYNFQEFDVTAFSNGEIKSAHGEFVLTKSTASDYVFFQPPAATQANKWFFSAAIPEDAFSIVKSIADGTCLSPQPEGTNFAVSVQCNGDESQKWAYNEVTKQIINAADKKCLTVWSVTSSTYVWARECTIGYNFQEFDVSTFTNGEIKSAHGELVLTKSSASEYVFFQLPSGSDLSKWSFSSVIPSDAFKQVIADYDGFCLTANAPGDRYAKALECTGASNQLWAFNAITGQLVNGENTNLCFAIYYMDVNSYAYVAECELGSDFQTFEVTSYTSGEVKNVANDRVLHRWIGNAENNVYVGTSFGGAGSFWTFQ
eukprot:snap_masked-scaffold_4-processed-gene-20.19-mRNA-1 protein AED:1.00 eAED:1.00 QI:0/-1/0/0/-1/1/1/0/441